MLRWTAPTASAFLYIGRCDVSFHHLSLTLPLRAPGSTPRSRLLVKTISSLSCTCSHTLRRTAPPDLTPLSRRHKIHLRTLLPLPPNSQLRLSLIQLLNIRPARKSRTRYRLIPVVQRGIILARAVAYIDTCEVHQILQETGIAELSGGSEFSVEVDVLRFEGEEAGDFC